jgi:phosphonate transport system ATP-binding protein
MSPSIPTIEGRPLVDLEIVGRRPRVRPSAEPVVLEATGLRCAFAGRGDILGGCSISLRPRELVAIVGPSGAGKTTLLRCLAGAERPRAGVVRRYGRVASIHQSLRLVPQSSALTNVLHGALGRLPWHRGLLRFPAAERHEAARLLARVGLGDRLHVPVGRLSGGEQQRVAIARALMQRPAVLLADEPVAALDRENAESVIVLLRRLAAERGIGVVTVLHDPGLAARHADRMLRLCCGHLEPCDGAAELAALAEPPVVDAATEEAGASGASGASEEPRGTDGRSTAAAAAAAATPAVSSLAAPPVLGLPRGIAFGLVGLLAVIGYAALVSGLDVSGRQLERSGPGIARFLGDLWPGSLAEIRELPWGRLGASLVETVRMAVVATTLGVLLSLPPAVLASRTLAPGWLVTSTRSLLSAIRVVPSLVWALFCVAAVGFGPLAGIIALTLYSVGYLTKFFSESIESVDDAAPGALREIGAGPVARFVHAIAPAAAPLLASNAMFMLEYNVRSASILGIVDAGGIGWHLKQFLDYRDFTGAIACLGLVLAVVLALDALSGRVRRWAVARSGRH